MIIEKSLQLLNSVILDKNHEMKIILAALLSGENILLEDEPGHGKTTLAKNLCKIFNLQFCRVQGTSDLLPMDILGGLRWDKERQGLHFYRGPIFTDFLLVDEINRIPPKTQSGFLQAMEEKIVTLDGQHYPLSDHFFVIATQNPITEIGTQKLPYAQLDRFGICISLGYPSLQAQREILFGDAAPTIQSSFCFDDLVKIRADIQRMPITPTLKDKIIKIGEYIKEQDVKFSIRGLISLVNMSKAYACVNGHSEVFLSDILDVLPSVTKHRCRNAIDIKVLCSKI